VDKATIMVISARGRACLNADDLIFSYRIQVISVLDTTTQINSELLYYNVMGLEQPRTRSGLIRIRFSKNGTPYVLISREDARLLADISPNWQILLDYAHDPPLQILPSEGTTTKALRSEDRTVVTSMRVGKSDWDWFKRKCRVEGTSTCREFRKWLHVAREDEEFPVTLRSGRGKSGSYVG
jgi:hypothetical protein